MTNFALRLPDHVMEQAKMAATEDNVSINQMLVSFISSRRDWDIVVKTMQERTARANVDATLILDKAPDVAPEAGDDIEETHQHGPIRR